MATGKVELKGQQLAILSALRGGPHTTLELQRAVGSLAVSARIHELRALGFPIDTQLISVRNRYHERCHVAQYFLRRKRTRRAKAA